MLSWDAQNLRTGPFLIHLSDVEDYAATKQVVSEIIYFHHMSVKFILILYVGDFLTKEEGFIITTSSWLHLSIFTVSSYMGT